MNRSLILGTVLLLPFVVGAGQALASPPCSFQTIGNTLSLNADCTTNATLFISDGYTLHGHGHTITAVDPVGAQFKGAILQNAAGAGNVNIRNVKLTTANLAAPLSCHVGNDKLRGIALIDAGGTIHGVDIIGLKHAAPTCNEGSGIIVNAAPFDGTHPATKSVTIEDVKVKDYQYVGMSVEGDVSAHIQDNRLVGVSAAGIPPAGQFGIASTNGAMATIAENSIKADSTSSNAGTVGVFLNAVDGNVVEDNSLNGSAVGVFTESFCQFAPSANQNRIVDNKIKATSEGVVLVARTQSGVSTCPAHVDQNLVLGNAIIAVSGGVTIAAGIYVGTQNFGGGFVPVADRNIIEDNLIIGFQPGIFQTGTDTNTVIQGNRVRP
jgi:hypothetical protein